MKFLYAQSVGIGGWGDRRFPAARLDCVRYQHECMDMEPKRSIFDLAREMKNGPWIEACCEANRQKLRHRGVKESNRKDAHFKVTQIRKFATAADAEGWVADVTKVIDELEGGMELEHLEHVRASLDPAINAQLPPHFLSRS